MLKAHLESDGHDVRTVDLNVEPTLWDAQGQYFRLLSAVQPSGSHDGHSKLWSLLNAHMQAFVFGVDAAGCRTVVRQVATRLGLELTVEHEVRLHEIVSSFFAQLGSHLSNVSLSGVRWCGVSVYSTSLAASLFTIQHMKVRDPTIRTIMGGGVFADDLALGSENLHILLDECDAVDHVVIGEGEVLLKKLIDGELDKKRVLTIADVGGQTLDLAAAAPPDYRDFELSSYLQLSIEGSRSCPFQCSFCSETTQWGAYRKKPSSLLATQMAELAKQHQNRAFFMGDSLINLYVNGLSTALLQAGHKLTYDGYLRADKGATSRDRVQDWASSGLVRVRLGLETASQRLLDRMDKRTSPDVMLSVLQALCEAGIRTTTYWVAGHPGETEADFQSTLTFLREAHPFIYELEVHPFYYYPNGQVASCRYKPTAAYSDEVHTLTRFRTWDPAGVSPARPVRFERLLAVAAEARRLGIPNIYSLAERYAAEARWHNLSPKALPVD